MTPLPRVGLDLRLIALTRTAKEAELTVSILGDAGVDCIRADDLEAVCARLEEGAGAVMLTEEAIVPGRNPCLEEWLARQPAWSDLPLLVLARPGADSAGVARSMDLLGNVTVLERPIRIAALVSSVRSALRARQRQYQLRDQVHALQESEHLFRTLVYASSQSIWQYHPSEADDAGRAVGPGGSPIDCVDAGSTAWWREFTGQSEEERTARDGHGWLDVVHEDDRDAALESWRRIMVSERPTDAEYRVRRHDGAWRWLLIRSLPIVGGTSRGQRAGTVVDITERKRAEVALLSKEAELQLVAEATPVALARCSRDRRFLFLNRAATDLFRRQPGEMIGRPILEIVGAETFAKIEPYIDQVLRGERTEFEERMGFPAGGPRWMRVIYDPERDVRGEVVGWFAAMVDVTEQRAAVGSLQRSEERYRSLVSVITDVPWVTDTDGAFVVPQTEWEAYTGQTWAQHGGFGWLQALHSDDRDEVGRAWAHARATGTLFEVRGRLWNQRLEEHCHVVGRATPIRNPDGTLREWIGTYTDVHEQHLAVRSLREADRRKDEFLAILAHELRNPLAPIRNSLHILRLAAQRDAALKEVVEMMDRQVNHMVRMVDDLMEVSRITRSKIELRKEPIEVAAIVRGAIETSRPLIDRAGHRLVISVPFEPLTLEADQVRLTQVLANLLNNAAKYTERAGEIGITVRREGDSVAISVRDSGSGIPREMLPRVFDLFTQVGRDTARGQGGLGIGLTLVKSLVEMHGGSVEALSEGEGKGSEFVVRLPLASPPRRVGLPAPTLETADNLAARSILVVDDNHDAADSLARLLELMGAQVEVAYSGPAALKALAACKPAAVVLDIGMPGMDGYEVARRIREQPDLRGLILIALTGWGQEEDRRQSRLAGFDHHLVKPADLDTLRDLLASSDAMPAAGGAAPCTARALRSA